MTTIGIISEEKKKDHYELNPDLLARYGFAMCTEGHRAGIRYLCPTETHEYVLGLSDIGLSIKMIYLDLGKGPNLVSAFKIFNDDELEFVLKRLTLLPNKLVDNIDNCVDI